MFVDSGDYITYANTYTFCLKSNEWLLDILSQNMYIFLNFEKYRSFFFNFLRLLFLVILFSFFFIIILFIF